MLKFVKHLISDGVVTNSFPVVVTEPPEGFLGRPVIDFEHWTACDAGAAACPTHAISIRSADDSRDLNRQEVIISLNLGDCIFCGVCAQTSPEAIHMSKEFLLAATTKADLVTQARFTVDKAGKYQFVEMIRAREPNMDSDTVAGERLKNAIHKLLGRSLHIREVDAGSCNGCEIEITSLNNPVYDIERFGIHFVASPRHADMLLVTGPVTRNMEIALKHTYDATPNPKVVVAVGACAIGGGIFGKSYASCGGAANVVPVDVFIPGCPPRPEALLHGILLAVGRLSRHRNS